MKEMILLFNFQDRERRLALEMLLFPLHVRLRAVKKEEYLKPLGSFAGSSDVTSVDELYEGPELPHEMLVFVNLPDEKLNYILANMRRSKVGSIPHKAVLTPTNQHWNTLECYQEIAAEHEAMQKMKQGTSTDKELK